jgi:hypothetical protein
LFELQVEVLQDLSEFLRNGKVMRPSTSADAVLEIAVKNGKNIIKKFQAFLDCGRESQRFVSPPACLIRYQRLTFVPL